MAIVQAGRTAVPSAQSAATDRGGGVFSESETLAISDSSAPDSSGQQQRIDAFRKSNFRSFLDKLEKRRKRIPCSHSCKAALRDAMLKVAKPSGLIQFQDLHLMLYNLPSGVPPSILKELSDVSRAYDCTGDKQIDMLELLDRALEVQPLMSTAMQTAIQVVAVVSWIGLSPLIYCHYADWSFLDALYFSVMIMTTVGCRDELPEDLGLRIFTAIYVLLGVMLLSWICLTCLSSLVVRYEARTRKLYIRRDVDLLADSGDGVTGRGKSLEDLTCFASARLEESARGAQGAVPGEPAATAKQNTAPKKSHAQCMGAMDVALASVVVWYIVLACGTCLYYFTAEDSTARLADALYWSIATSSTIGSSTLQLGGDDETLGRCLTLLFVALAVPLCAVAVWQLGDAHLQIRFADLEAQVISRVLEPDALIDMDANDVGVNQVEFLCAMLLALDKVSGSDLWHVLNLFAMLDVDGSGILDRRKLLALHRDVSKRAETWRSEHHRCRCCIRRRKSSTIDTKLLATEPSLTPHDAEKHLQPATKLEPAADPGAYASQPSAAMSTGVQETEELVARDVVTLTEGEDAVDGSPAAAGLSKSLFEDLYQDNAKVRRQLDEKSEELVASLQSRQHVEQALRQVWAERQALHGEVRLLQHKATECQARADLEVRRQEDAEARRSEAERMAQDAERRVQEAERRRQESEKARIDAEQRAARAEQLCAEAEAKAQQADDRAGGAEQRAAEVIERLRDAEQEWRLQNESRVREFELKAAEMDMQRQGEVRSALLELQSLAQGQQALRTELHRVRPPPALTFVAPKAAGNSNHSLRLRSGQQPWEVWERASTWTRDSMSQQEPEAPRTALLSGRVKEQIEFLDKQVRELEKRHVWKDQSTQLPGWV